MALIVFLHGLNTFGDSLIHVGPLTFGPMHENLEIEFRKRGFDFLAVPGIGSGAIEDQAERAFEFLESNGVNVADKELIFFGQSTGGLVARALSHHPKLKSKVIGLFTMGSPHAGAEIAQFGLEFDSKFPRLQKLFGFIGYNTLSRRKHFDHLTPQALELFNKKFPSRATIQETCLLCEVNTHDVSLPLKALGRLTGGATLKPGDAFISSRSQCRGEVVGPFALDHFAQLGTFLHFSPSARRRGRAEFQRLLDMVASRIKRGSA